MATPQWEKVEAKSHSAWLELREACPEVGKDYTWTEASVRFDGCTHFFQAGNVPFDAGYGRAGEKRDKDACDDHIHICDIDAMIAHLYAIKAAALEHFGPHWPH